MERWFYIGAGITAVSGFAGYALLPVTEMANSPPYSPVLLWSALTAMAFACRIVWVTVKMALRGQQEPITALAGQFDPKQAVAICAGTLLLALNLTFFLMIKPQLGHLVPFTADPMLADWDRLIFSADPWRLFAWFNHPALSILYHRAWFFWLAFVVFYVLTLPAGVEKDRLLISYLMLWSFFGPLVHLAFPAAGPIFFDELGLGDRFAALHQSERTEEIARYLWFGYTHRLFAPASGISAMPSLHLATMFWTLIAIRNTRWLGFGVALTVYIFVGSILTGWHYAVDDFAGFAGAWLCYALTGLKLGGKQPARALQTEAEVGGSA